MANKIIVDVPDALYEEFREMLDSRNETTAFVIKNLIRSWLAEVEGEPKPKHYKRAALSARKMAVVRPRSDGRRYSDDNA